eukprot:11216213-Lingulodinium_polyedra.AAC.1
MASELCVYLRGTLKDYNLEDSFMVQAEGNGFEFWRLVNVAFKPHATVCAIIDFIDILSNKLFGAISSVAAR